MPLLLLLLQQLLLVVGLLGQAGAAAAASSAGAAAPLRRHVRGVAWAVQLSDPHISRYVHPSIAPDLEVFGASVLAGVLPSALLITGDLVDAKTANHEGSRQYPDEWAAYARAWRRMAAAAGLPAARVLDVRGNHDVFDARRGDMGAEGGGKVGEAAAAAAAAEGAVDVGDGFLRHSATAAALGAAGAMARARATQLPPRLLLVGDGGSGESGPAAAAADVAAAAAGACPAALLFGVDATPDVRMRAYT